MDAVTKKEYNVRDLGTKSVTLFPSRAQIVREIKDLQLAPGANEITIVGLTPTVDEESIKVEGSGSAIITDIAIELLPNRDIFQEIYPDSDDDDDKSATESDSETTDPEDEDPADLVAVRDKLCLLRDEQKRAKEVVASADSRLKFLDAYGKMLDRKRNVAIEDGIETYRAEREKVFQDHLAGTIRERELNKEINEAYKEERRMLKIQAKERERIARAKAKIQKGKAREQEKKDRREAQRKKEKARIRKERENFWAKYCYSVTITLESAAYTPMSSRRTSIASEADVQLVKEKAAQAEKPVGAGSSNGSDPSASNTCDLSLTYVTSSAFWAPSYDLQLSTTNNTAMLCFDAQLTNATSETWTNAKVTLSTSQTTFAGLEDNLPTLVPWHIKLAGRGSGILENDILNSREERNEQMGYEVHQRQHMQVQKPRANLFGVWEQGASLQDSKQVQQQLEMSKAAQVQQLQQTVQNARGGGFGYSNNNINNMLLKSSNIAPQQASMFGSAYPPPAPKGGLSMERASAPRKRSSAPQMKKRGKARSGILASASIGGGGGRFEECEEECDDGPPSDGSSDDDGDDGTMMEPMPELDFQDSAMEETGLTTTFDLPGTKTLAPKSTASKQRVARVNFSNIVFNHTVVAKYKPVAYLKAKLKNNSKLTLLKGPAGLTLDGSFMGRTKLPRCSAGDSFHLSLGVDPAIRVTYPKPDVRRSTIGLFAKEDCAVYTRSVTIANTKAAAGKSVNILVLDQVPVPEDERLRVDILAPRGLVVGGNAVNAGGVPTIKTAASDDKAWGKATALLRKGGEVVWDVELRAGKGVKLGLEYDVAVPAGEHVVQC